MDKKTFNQLINLYYKKSLTSNDIEDLNKFGYISNGNISKSGLNALEPYKVKRAIIVGAGFGSRMIPITLTTPKPLVKVNGIRIVDTLIDKLVKEGITDITFVRGYLKEKFDELLIKYPFIKFIDNDRYNEENNISSAVLACDLLENAYLCEADLLINSDDVILKYQYESNFTCIKADITDDWCFKVDKDGYIYNYGKEGTDCYRFCGISYWTKEDAIHFKNRLLEMYSNKEYRKEFYEMCPLKFYKDEFKIGYRNLKDGSIIEIDSYEELKTIDSSYK